MPPNARGFGPATTTGAPMTTTYARRVAAARCDLVFVDGGYFTREDAAMISAARDKANRMIAEKMKKAAPNE